MSGALDPIQEDLPLGLPSGSGPPVPDSPIVRAAPPNPQRPPSLFEQLWSSLGALPWARWRARAAPILRTGAQGLGGVARVAVTRGGTVAKFGATRGGGVARVAVKRGAPYTIQLAKATAQISLIRAFPLLIARTIHLFGFPAVVVRTAIQYSIAHRAGLAIDEVKYFRVDDPAGYTVYEAPSRLSTAIAITYLSNLVLLILGGVCLAPALTPRVVLELPVTWVSWLQGWLGLAFAAHAFPSYEEAGPASPTGAGGGPQGRPGF